MMRVTPIKSLILVIFALTITFGMMLFKNVTQPWALDPQSLSAQRMRRVNERLAPGMTREQVEKVFAEDAARNPYDHIEDDSELKDPIDPPLPRELTLGVVELPRFPSSFGTYWEVRSGFNKQGFLVTHGLEGHECCGP